MIANSIAVEARMECPGSCGAPCAKKATTPVRICFAGNHYDRSVGVIQVQRVPQTIDLFDYDFTTLDQWRICGDVYLCPDCYARWGK